MRKISPIITFACCVLLLLPVALFSLLGNRAPTNVFMPDGGNKVVHSISDVFIQGWGFFTRDPTEMRTVLYTQDETSSTWNADSLDTPSQQEVAFGLSRERRAYLADLGHILDDLEEQDADYISCGTTNKESFSECATDTSPIAVQFDTSPYKKEWCGENVIIAQFQPIPFGYAQYTDQQKAHALKVNVHCNK